MRHFGFDTSRFFRCVVRLCASKTRSSEIKIANPKQGSYYFPVPYKLCPKVSKLLSGSSNENSFWPQGFIPK